MLQEERRKGQHVAFCLVYGLASLLYMGMADAALALASLACWVLAAE